MSLTTPIEVRIWKANEQIPLEPQFVFTDTVYSDGGFVRLINSNQGSPSQPDVSAAIFSQIHVADMPIHELPAPLVCSPINTLQGDLDGDGTVGFADFLVLSANFGNDVETYSDGDVTCDGAVGFDDFLALSANFGQSLAAGAEVQTAALVPEPSMATLGFIAFASLAVISRRREY